MATSNNYTIYLSDPAFYNTPVVVQDGYVDSTQLSINLVGRNAAGYGQALSENFVHMLENFSSSTPPGNALTGQLWYDSSNKTLKVLNGQWYPVGGVFRQGLQPSNANEGDIWVDTSKQQMYIINASNEAILVGPNYSGNTRTGLYATTATDVYGESHNIVINYINDNAIEIISGESFTPVTVIDGFTNIKAGVNLTNKNLGTFQAPIYAKFNGTSYASDNLVLTTGVVNANNFVRSDVAQTLNGVITFGQDAGVQIGSVPTFILKKNHDYEATFLNSYQGGQGVFRFINLASGVQKQLFELHGADKIVRVGLPGNPMNMNVTGIFTASSSVTLAGPVTITSTNNQPSTIAGNALVVAGGVGIGGTLVTDGEHILTQSLRIGEIGRSGYAAMKPAYSGLYLDLGENSNRWNVVYATTFNGDRFTGIAASATALVNLIGIDLDTTTKPLTEITYRTTSRASTRGDGSNLILDLKITPPAISNKAVTTSTYLTDTVLIHRALDESGNPTTPTLYQQTKSSFMQDHLPLDTLEYTGMIMPWAPYTVRNPATGVAAGVPDGWDLCDGYSVAVTNAKYARLFSKIQYDFSPSGTNSGATFNLPDLSTSLAVSGASSTNRSTQHGGYISYIIKL
jgi:hypothetical protein